MTDECPGYKIKPNQKGRCRNGISGGSYHRQRRVQRRDTDGHHRVLHTAVVPDDKLTISRELCRCADELGCDLVLTTGGTGLSSRDVTPEATRAVVHREIPAIPQTMLYASLAITPRAMLSRAAAGTRGSCLIINLPGSEKAARENLAAVLDTLGHALEMLRGGGH